jgi:hypothetical protein
MKILILALTFAAACAFAQPSAPVWLSQIKLSGVNGLPDHPLAVINGKTLAPGEECDLKLKGRTVHVQCLDIREQYVLVQIQGLTGPCELTFSGNLLPVENSLPAAASSPTPATAAAPAPVMPIRLFVPTVAASQPPDSGKFFSISIGWVAVAIIVAIIFALLAGIGIGAGPARWQHRKNIGEAMLSDTIDSYFSRPYLLLNNVTLPTDEGTTQIDHVLVADTGIFVIEAKHYSGWIFGEPSASQWTQTIYHHKSRFQNPLRQNYGHVKTLQALFSLPEDHFHSVVVFTGAAEFKTDLGPGVLRLADLVPFLTADRPVVFDERKMAYIVGRIEMKRERRSLETDEYHLNHIRNRLAGKTPRSKPQAVFPAPPSNPFASDSGDEKYQPKG